MNDLGILSDPACLHAPINIEGYEGHDLESFLKSMIIIRKTEAQLALGRREGLIGGPVHLAAGQEAIAVGASFSLRKTDRVFGAHRSHSHLLALNPNFYKLFAEVLGKETGYSRGMGGSMHLWDQDNGFYGSVPIVAGTVPLAVGAGLAAKMQSKAGSLSDVGVAYVGDGAVEEGVVHESLNLASSFKLPVLFVVENNLFASHMHISQRQPSNKICRFAEANLIQSELVDGNDVIAVANATQKLVENARLGNGPALLEAITYRWYGHVDWREDIDVGIERSVDDVKNWRARDPISRLSSAMKHAGIWTEEQEMIFGAQVDHEIREAWEQAIKDPYPNKDAIMKYVFE